MFASVIPGLRRAGFREDDIHYFTLHVEQDVDHGTWLEEALLRFGGTEEARSQIRRGALLSLEARARFWSGVVFALWAFIAGVLGLLLTLLWTVTHHVASHQNENLLLFNPLWLVLAVLVPMSAVKGRLARFTRGLVLLLVVTALVAPLLHVVGLSRQSTLEIIGLALPAALAMGWTVLRGTSAR
jgi:hypothetical protein